MEYSQQGYGAYNSNQQQQFTTNGSTSPATRQLSQEQINANVAASIQQAQSIVVPTMSQNMMQEFSQKNTQRIERQMGNLSLQQQQTTNNPFDTMHMPAATQPQQPSVVPRFTTSDISAPLAPAAATARIKEAETLQLVGVVSGFLKRRREQRHLAPAEIGELSGQIKSMTGKAWSTHWQLLHGRITDFIKAHPQSFTIVRNKYVVLAGHEYEVNIPPAETTPQLDKMPTPVPSAISSNVPLNMLPPKATSYDYSQPYQTTQQPYYYNTPQPTYDYQATTTPPPAAAPPNVQSTDYTNPFMQQQFPNVPFPQQHSTPPPPIVPPATNDDGWVLFDDDSADLNAPIQFTTTATTPAWYSTTPPVTVSATTTSTADSNPLAIFESSSSSSSAFPFEDDLEAKKKKEKKERKAKKKQMSQDEKLARQLQEEEDRKLASQMSATSGTAHPARTSSGTAGATFNPHAHVPEGGKVALTHAEVRELAENEIGKDNIKILAGFSVIKFGREGRPHQRRMWINSAITHLAWESSQFDGSHRGLELAKVNGLRVGEMTRNIRRSTKDKSKVAKLCFSLETEQRTLDLQACSVIQRDALASALKKVVEFNHKHKPRRVDRYRTELYL